MKYKGLRSITRNASFLFGAQGVRIVVRTLYAVILARYLGPKLYGLLNYGISWYLAFLPFTLLGIGTLLSREIGRDRRMASRILIPTLVLRSGFTLATASVCAAIALLTESVGEIRWLLGVFTLALIGRSLSLWANSVYAAYENTRYELQQEFVFRLMDLGIGWSALLLGGQILTIATIHAVIWCLQGLHSLWLVHTRFTPLSLLGDWRHMKRLLAQALTLGSVILCSNWMLQGPLILFRHLEGVSVDLGQLALALQAFFVLIVVPSAVARASLPILSRSVVRQDGKDRLYLEGMLRVGLLFGATTSLAGFALGPSLVAFIFGTDYTKTGTLLGPALAVLGPLTCASAANQALIAHWQIKAAIVAALLGTVTMTGLFPFLVARLDILGAVLAEGCGFAVWATAAIVACNRSRGIAWRRTMLHPLLAIVISVSAYLFLEPYNTWIAFVTSLSVLVCTVYLFRIVSTSELAAITEFIRHLQGPSK